MKTEQGIANLPFARGKVFRTFDSYIAHREALGAIDLPWWREISPDTFEHVVRMPDGKREIVSRQELMRRFGFDK